MGFTSTTKRKLKDISLTGSQPAYDNGKKLGNLSLDGAPATDNAVTLNAPIKNTTGYSPTFTSISNNNSYSNPVKYGSGIQTSDLASKFANVGKGVNYGDSQTTEQKTYNNPYASQIQSLLGDINNKKEFKYNMESDPNYQAYKNAYTTQANADFSNNLAGQAALTGGMPSSYAGSVASQARASTMQGLNDKIPQLMEAAYSKYDADRNNKLNTVSTLSGLGDSDYSKFTNNRDFAYNQDVNNRNFNYDALNNDRNFDYSKAVNDRDFNYNQDTNNRDFKYQNDRNNVEDKQWQANYNADQQNTAFNNNLNSRQQQFNEDTTNQEYAANRSDYADSRSDYADSRADADLARAGDITDGELYYDMQKDLEAYPDLTVEEWVNNMAVEKGLSRETINWLLKQGSAGSGSTTSDLGLKN